MRPPPIEPQFTRQTGRQVRPAATNDLVGLFDNQRGSAPQEQIVGQIGGISTVHLHFAAEFLENLPARIREAAHDPFGACALIYGLLLSPDKKARDKQWEHLNQHGNPEVLHELERLREAVLQLPAEAKLPIMDLTLPALRQMSAAQYGKFRPNLQALVEADQEIDLFEYALLKVMTHHLEPVFHPKSAKKVTRYHSFKALEHECAVLLAGMAHVGHPEEERERQIAFQSGKALLGSSGAGCQWLPFESCNLKEMDGALDRLSGASPGIKRRFIRALAATAACDGTIQRKEGELLRAVADSLDCPIPPFVRPDAVQS